MDENDATVVSRPQLDPPGSSDGLPPGVTLGEYTILKMLGRGGMGEVYEVEHARLGRRYAMKVLPAQLSADPQFRERFEKEARTLAKLEHEHIVRVYYAGESDKRFYLVMELLPASLLQIVRPKLAEGAPPRSPHDFKVEAPRARQWLQEILEGLSFAHTNGIVHRDIKPANILLDATGRLKLADFGVARVLGEDFMRTLVERTVAQAMSNATTVVQQPSFTEIVGTIDYMAPEVRSGMPADARSDLYAVGMMAYEFLTGMKPGAMARPPSQAAPGLDPAWDAWVERALAPDPAARWPNARAMREALPSSSPVASPSAVRAPPPPAPASPPLRPAAAPSSRTGLFALVAAVVLAGGGFAAWRFLAPSGAHDKSSPASANDQPAVAPPVLESDPPPATAQPPAAAHPGEQNNTASTPAAVTAAAGELFVRIEPASAAAVVSVGGFADLRPENGELIVSGLAPGEHDLTAQAPGFRPFRMQVRIAAGRTDAAVRLIGLLGMLEIVAPPGTDVTAIDARGKSTHVGVVPAGGRLLSTDLLLPGRYSVRLEPPGGPVATVENVILALGKPATITPP